MKYQAHRGVQSEYPENTMVSYQAAVDQGYEIIELDPAVTRDGRFVMMHDRTVNRTGRLADGSKLEQETRVEELTLEEIRAMEFGSWFDEKFRGEPAPLVSDVLAFAAKNGMDLKIDNKFEEFQGETMEAFLSLFDPYPCGNIAFSLRDKELAARICKRFPKCKIVFDGITREEELIELQQITAGHELQIWIPIRSELTSWWKGAFLTKENAALVNRYAKACAWILDDQEELRRVRELCDPYAIETTGKIKPGD